MAGVAQHVEKHISSFFGRIHKVAFGGLIVGGLIGMHGGYHAPKSESGAEAGAAVAFNDAKFIVTGLNSGFNRVFNPKDNTAVAIAEDVLIKLPVALYVSPYVITAGASVGLGGAIGGALGKSLYHDAPRPTQTQVVTAPKCQHG